MRLINARTLLVEDFTLQEKPQYAILSHTWGEGEVTYQDMTTACKYEKNGWSKIVKTCELAISDGYEYAWVDTCCIDKTSSAELSEAINSMFKWYKEAAVCFAYLSDLANGSESVQSLWNWRWWTRGWTLQELLASKYLVFYDSNWRSVGTKKERVGQISDQTGVPTGVLRDSTLIPQHPVAVRMLWAAKRQTTRVEDEAYCLLGVFDVNMPLIYGEGRKAFHRLQLEIIRSGTDLSILLCNTTPESTLYDPLLAESVAQFIPLPQAFCNKRTNPSVQDISVVNRYLKLTSTQGRLAIQYISSKETRERARYLFMCKAISGDPSLYVPLIKVASGTFVRAGEIIKESNKYKYRKFSPHTEIKIAMSPTIGDMSDRVFRSAHGIGLSWPGQSAENVVSVQPGDPFDYTRLVFLHRDELLASVDMAAVVLKLEVVGYELPRDGQIVALFNLDVPHLTSKDSRLIIFWKGDHPELEEYMFSEHKSRRSLRWPKLRNIAGEFLDRQSSKIPFCFDQARFCLKASLLFKNTSLNPEPAHPIFSIRLNFEREPATSER